MTVSVFWFVVGAVFGAAVVVLSLIGFFVLIGGWLAGMVEPDWTEDDRRGWHKKEA